MVISLKILGCDCDNYFCVNLGIYLVTAYNFYMAISSDHVAWAPEHFAKMLSLFPVPASRLSETLQNNSGKYNVQFSNCENTDLVLFNLYFSYGNLTFEKLATVHSFATFILNDFVV
jgi:hypothetical protein